MASPSGSDPRALEADRIRAALAGGDHVRVLDAAAKRWCHDQLDAHFTTLARLPPVRALERGRIEYTRAPSEAIARSIAVMRLPFVAPDWDHLVRLDRWSLGVRRARFLELPETERLATGAIVPLIEARPHDPDDGPSQRAMILRAAIPLVALHLATLDDDASPLRPLVALVTRRVFPIAQPDRAIMLFLEACEGDVPATSHDGELPFLYALACDPDDAATRLVYGDYLEQRGDLQRARQIRSGADLTTVSVNVRQLFANASWLFPDHRIRNREGRAARGSAAR